LEADKLQQNDFYGDDLMEKDIRKMTVTELGNEIYLFSKRLQAEQSQLSQMEKLYAEKYNAEAKEVKKNEVKK
jgi:hypothetical protein